MVLGWLIQELIFLAKNKPTDEPMRFGRNWVSNYPVLVLAIKLTQNLIYGGLIMKLEKKRVSAMKTVIARMKNDVYENQ